MKTTISAANEARFTAAHLSEPLTQFAAGWRDPSDLQGLLDTIAPSVPVGRRFEYKAADSKDAFLSESDDIRTIGASFKRVEYTGKSVQAKTFNKGLTIRVDHDEETSDDWAERYVGLLMQRLLRNELRRAVAALDAAATAAGATWDPGAVTLANPFADIRAQLSAGADEAGLRPNRVVFGETAMIYLLDVIEAHQGALGFVPADNGALARKLGVQTVRDLPARFATTGTPAPVLGNVLYAFFAEDGLMTDDPSNLKRFVTPTPGGSPVRVFLDEHDKYTDISVEHYSNVVVTSPLGIRKLTISNS